LFSFGRQGVKKLEEEASLSEFWAKKSWRCASGGWRYASGAVVEWCCASEADRLVLCIEDLALCVETNAMCL